MPVPTARFALLIAAVLAAGTAIFIAIHGYLPPRGESLSDRVTRCNAELLSEPAFTAPAPERQDRIRAATARYRACVRPAAWSATRSTCARAARTS